MVPDEPESDASGDARAAGVGFGPLQEELATHDYPATREELIDAYGEYELQLAGGTETFADVLGRERDEDGGESERFESADEVEQAIIGMVGDEAVGRKDYTDRGGSVEGEAVDGESSEDQSF